MRTRKIKAASLDNFLTAIPDLIEGLDTLAQLLDVETLLCSLACEKNRIFNLQKQITEKWKQAYDLHYQIIKQDGYSSYTHFNIWGKGKVAKIQCDIAAMLSPATFEELALPFLKDQCDFLDHSLFHLDGPEAIRHLDSILTIDRLDGLQWSAGAGQPDGGDECWDFIYKKALNKGKNIYAFVAAEKVPDFVKRFGATGIYISTSVNSKKVAQELYDCIDGILK